MLTRVLQLIGLCVLWPALLAGEPNVPTPKPTTPKVDAAAAVATNVTAAKHAYVIPIQAEIGSAVLYVVRRGIKEAMVANADVVVFDMKTPGGALGPTLEIMEAIEKFPGLTMTYVNTEAISAGAFISAATHEIWFAPRGIIGAAAPVSSGGQEVDPTMKMKIVSYLTGRVRAVSEGKGYRGEVVSAMIDAERELKIDDKVIKPKGSLLSLTSSEAAETYGDPPRPLLSAGTADSIADLLAQRFPNGAPELTRLELTWSETLAAWLNSIAPILLGIGLLALFVEFKTPGFGVFGVVGIVALGVVFASNYIAGLSGHEPVLFFALGLLLLAVEIFFFPGTLLPGITGLVLIFGSLVWSMADLWPDEPLSEAWSTDAFTRPLTNLGIGMAIALAGGAALLRYLPRGWFLDKLIVQSTIGGSAQVAGGGMQEAAEVTTLVGQEGLAVTALHPSGQIEIGGRRYEARVEVGAIERGRTVIVRSHSDFGLIVEEKP